MSREGGLTVEKTFVLRTEAILASVNPTLRFGGDNTIVIPMAILQNLYRYDGLPEKQKLAAQFIEYIDSLPIEELICSQKGFKQQNGSYLKIVENQEELDESIQKLGDFSRLDKRVFQVCLDLKKKEERKVILISKNPSIRMKAFQLGIEAQMFKDEIFPPPKQQYKGYVNVSASQTVISKLYRDGEISLKEIYQYGDIEWFENEFLIIESESGSALGRYTNGKIVPLTYSQKLPVGCKSLNVEQTMLWECLLAPPEIAPLVVVKGAAGTGKTYCSIAMTLEKLRGYSLEELYDQILVATPTVTVSNESIGYLPGTIDDKIGPYLGGIIDNIKAIFREKNMDLTNRDLKANAQELFERGFIEIQPIGFLRGRTIPRTVFIIDETQNISPSDIHDIVTRAAQGSKFIFLGDPDQVNNPKLNTRYNALVYLSEKMKGSVNCWQITLNSDKSIRSALAQEALKIL